MSFYSALFEKAKYFLCDLNEKLIIQSFICIELQCLQSTSYKKKTENEHKPGKPNQIPWSPLQTLSHSSNSSSLPVPQAPTSMRRLRLSSRPNLRIWTRRRTPRRSTPTSRAPPTPRTCSLCSTPSPTSSSRTTWRTVASSNNLSEEESRWV